MTNPTVPPEIFAITCPREVPGGRYSGMRLIKVWDLSENLTATVDALKRRLGVPLISSIC